MSVGAGVLHLYHHFLVKLLCVLERGLHCYHHFPELKFLWGGGGGGLHFYRTFTWMCCNVGPQHDMPNQTSDVRLYTHSCRRHLEPLLAHPAMTNRVIETTGIPLPAAERIWGAFSAAAITWPLCDRAKTL